MNLRCPFSCFNFWISFSRPDTETSFSLIDLFTMASSSDWLILYSSSYIKSPRPMEYRSYQNKLDKNTCTTKNFNFLSKQGLTNWNKARPFSLSIKKPKETIYFFENRFYLDFNFCFFKYCLVMVKISNFHL